MGRQTEQWVGRQSNGLPLSIPVTTLDPRHSLSVFVTWILHLSRHAPGIAIRRISESSPAPDLLHSQPSDSPTLWFSHSLILSVERVSEVCARLGVWELAEAASWPRQRVKEILWPAEGKEPRQRCQYRFPDQRRYYHLLSPWRGCSSKYSLCFVLCLSDPTPSSLSLSWA